MSAIIPVDHNWPFSWNSIQPGQANLFTESYSDERAKTLSSLDPALLTLEPLLVFPRDRKIVDLAGLFLERFEAIKDSDAVLLDAYACRAMVARNHLLPPPWALIVESEAHRTGDIRYDGTSFINADSEEVVLTSETCRGTWGMGCLPRFYTEKELKVYRQPEVVFTIYTAVYRR